MTVQTTTTYHYHCDLCDARIASGDNYEAIRRRVVIKGAWLSDEAFPLPRAILCRQCLELYRRASEGVSERLTDAHVRLWIGLRLAKRVHRLPSPRR